MSLNVWTPASARIAYSMAGGIAPTVISDVDSSAQTRRKKWTTGPMKLALQVIGTKANVRTDYAFIKSVGGFTAFKMKEIFEDHSITGESIGTGNDVRKIFYTEHKYIDTSTLTVYDDSVEVSTDDYTVANESGKITFDSAIANGNVVTADYEFYRKWYFDIKTTPINDIIISYVAKDVWQFEIALMESLI
jgi:hypothetical protein